MQSKVFVSLSLLIASVSAVNGTPTGYGTVDTTGYVETQGPPKHYGGSPNSLHVDSFKPPNKGSYGPQPNYPLVPESTYPHNPDRVGVESAPPCPDETPSSPVLPQAVPPPSGPSYNDVPPQSYQPASGYPQTAQGYPPSQPASGYPQTAQGYPPSQPASGYPQTAQGYPPSQPAEYPQTTQGYPPSQPADYGQTFTPSGGNPQPPPSSYSPDQYQPIVPADKNYGHPTAPDSPNKQPVVTTDTTGSYPQAVPPPPQQPIRPQYAPPTSPSSSEQPPCDDQAVTGIPNGPVNVSPPSSSYTDSSVDQQSTMNQQSLDEAVAASGGATSRMVPSTGLTMTSLAAATGVLFLII